MELHYAAQKFAACFPVGPGIGRETVMRAQPSWPEMMMALCARRCINCREILLQFIEDPHV